MILPLRRRHRRMWIALAILLPFAIALAWWSRRPAALMDQLPPELVDKEVRP